MKSCTIFGGSGFVGTHLARHLLAEGRFDHIHLADIRPSTLIGTSGITFSFTDVRQEIPARINEHNPDWIFNLAAVHREPGHAREEYFDTNLKGAKNVCEYAEATNCANIYFTSSISVYGPTDGPTDEDSPIQPTTPYGSSKFPAELIHEGWYRSGEGRRLIISRPGVIYGPGDPGNILRMIKAIRKGYFAFPGSPRIHKSYGYIYGLLDSIDYLMQTGIPYFCYNYVETPTEPLYELVNSVKDLLGVRALIMPLPMKVLEPTARLIQTFAGDRNPIHPVRVRKAATPTYIIPKALKTLGFEFKYDFRSSLEHWYQVAPDDFREVMSPEATPVGRTVRLVRQAKRSRAADQSIPQAILKRSKNQILHSKQA